MVITGKRRRLQRELFWSYLFLTTAALMVVSFTASRALIHFHRDEAKKDLQVRAKLIARELQPLFSPVPRLALQQRCRVLGKQSDVRVSIIAPDGTVWGDSRGNPEQMDNHGDRPEVLTAREVGLGSARRYSHTLRQEMLYVAFRANENDVVVRLSVPLSRMAQARQRLMRGIGMTGVLFALVAAVVSFAMSQRITRPLEQARRGAMRFARGDLGFRLSVPPQAEVAQLVDTLNDMAGRLESHIREIKDQQSAEETILSSMIEGLIAVDVRKRVIRVNQAAFHLMRVPAEDVRGRGMEEVFRHADLLRFFSRVLSGEDMIEDELVVRDDTERILQAHGSVLRRDDGEPVGAVAVLHDITRIRALERVRQEFVANVSHELKTPVMSIQGFVETLQEGAMNDPREAHHFLGIVARQTERLHSIINDLLTLSQLEEQAGTGDVAMEVTPLTPVLEAVVRVCNDAAADRQISIRIDSPENLSVRMNPPLIEQALLNLIENAIKYGSANSSIDISVICKNREVVIRVKDYGSGIASDHLERLFERFYRIDKARGNDEGTGLGLSIVKHIAQVHHGSVGVSSRFGFGSDFTLSLPMR